MEPDTVFWNTILAVREHIGNSMPEKFIAISHGISSDGPCTGVDEGQVRPVVASDTAVSGTDMIIELCDTGINWGEAEIHGKSDSGHRNMIVFKSSGAFECKAVSRFTDQGALGQVTEHQLTELEQYLPYALLPFYSRKNKKCFAISHFAQTLDGRIASNSGDSRWIGNQENLTHAHKMRALCDGILIGANTQRLDKPSLTVRHVHGRDPVRIIIGGQSMSDEPGSALAGEVLHIGKSSECQHINAIKRVDGNFDCEEVLAYIYQRGLASVYIEGGARTTSNFLKTGALDQVQIHFSPLLLGSGTTGFEFGGIPDMQQAMEFTRPRFVPMGEQIMFVGETKRANL